MSDIHHKSDHTIKRSYRSGNLVSNRPGWGSSEYLYVILGWRRGSTFVGPDDVRADCELVMLPFGPGPLKVVLYDDLEQIVMLTDI